MKINSILFCIGQGFKNLFKNKWYSFASISTMAACIFLLSISFAIILNVRNIVHRAETEIGVTVFFEKGLSQEEIEAIGQTLIDRPEVESYHFVSAEEAWEKMKTEYFGENPELAEGFANDNPLANSASYEIFLHTVEEQPAYVEFVKGVAGVRKVNYSATTVEGFGAVNRVVTAVSVALIVLLLVVSVFLISNTIALAIHNRREEIRITRLIGATSGFVRAPFLIEGLILGALGGAIPLIIMWYVYEHAVTIFGQRLGIFSSLFNLLPAGEVFRYLTPVALVLGIGIGLIGSQMALRRNLKV